MKKVIALLLSMALVIGCLAACSKSDDNKGGSTGTGTGTGTSDTKEEITIEIYDDAANFNGEFAKTIIFPLIFNNANKPYIMFDGIFSISYMKI